MRDWTKNPWATKNEETTFEDLLPGFLEDTYNCWIRTRLRGISASMGCDQGNISVALLKKFDQIRKVCAEPAKF